jgi:large subunit ribosomal protein L3
MISGFVAQKGQMTNLYLDNGKRIAVTQCQVSPLVVTQVKEPSGKDAYSAIQVAYGQKKNLDRPTSARLAKNKLDLKPRFFKEFKPSTDSTITVGQQITIDQVLNVGDEIKVTGVSKGRGFAGVIKRYGFHRQPVTGGQSDRVRAPGAIGAQTPGKVVKGKKMPGHYGNAKNTIKGLKIIAIDTQKGLLTIQGSVPGPIGSWLLISKI